MRVVIRRFLTSPQSSQAETHWGVNLLSNATKYTKSGEIKFIFASVTSEHWSICVSDTGVGIASEDSDRVFEEFERAARDDNPGTRLGPCDRQGTVPGVSRTDRFCFSRGRRDHIRNPLPVDSGKSSMSAPPCPRQLESSRGSRPLCPFRLARTGNDIVAKSGRN